MTLRLGGDGAITGCTSLEEPAISISGLTLTTPIEAVSGTAAAPSYTFSGDTDNGLYYAGTNSIGVSTAGTSAIVVDASQRVGIGTTSPVAQLDIRGASNNIGGYIYLTGLANTNAGSLGRFGFYNTASQNAANPLRAYITSTRQNSAWGADIQFFTSTGTDAATSKVTINEGGNVGIGTISPAIKTEIVGGSGGSETNLLQLRSNATDVNTGTGLRFSNSTSNSADTTSAEIVYKRTNSPASGAGDLLFKVANGTSLFEAMRIRAGGGLTFNGDTAAANALDDYEEGTFTPTLTFATPGTSSFGYTGQTGGRYTKIGRFVHCRIEIRLNAFSKGTASGDLQIDGLPFSATGGGTFGQFIGNFASFQTPLPTAAGNFPIVLVLLNQSKAQFKVIVNNANWNTFPDPDNNSQYKIDLQYYV